MVANRVTTASMFSIILLGSTFLLLSAPQASAQHWEFKNPVPTSSTLRQIRTLSPGVFVGVGDVGTVVISNDGGSTWRTSGIDTRETPMKLTTSDENTCWVVGTGGLIAKSSDAGTNWVVLSQDVMIPELYDAYFPDAQHGMVIGQKTIINGISVGMAQVIMRTQDGGHTWSTEIPNMDYLQSLSFVDRDYGWIAGQRMYRTTDGGTTWQRLAPPSSDFVSGLKFFDRGRGVCWSATWTGSENRTKMFTTADSGYTWTPTLDTIPITRTPVFTNESEFWLAAETRILRSTDGGGSFNTMLTSYDDSFQDLAVDGATVIAVGAYGRIWQSTDTGGTWTRKFSGQWTVLRSIAFADSTGWAVGGGSAYFGHTFGSILLRSSDRGEHWDSLSCPTDSYLYSITFADHYTGWLGGASGTMLKTTDGGTSWEPQQSGATGTINQIRFLDKQNGWAVSEDGSILRTIDGGNLWQKGLINAPMSALEDIQMLDFKHGYAVGAANTLLRTGDGGLTWNNTGIPQSFDYYGVYFIDTLKGFAAGSEGHVLKTTDGGNSWYIMTMYTSSKPLRSVSFSGPDTGFVVGDAGYMFMTTDGGTRWSYPSSGTFNSLYRVAAFQGVGSWIVGENGSILHFVSSPQPTTGVGPTHSSIPTGLLLYQNYPNPFNPSTTIRYSLPRGMHVALTVYNTLGQQVAILVDEDQVPGNHDVRFDGRNLSSGVYFYRLRAGEYLAVKRLLLLK